MPYIQQELRTRLNTKIIELVSEIRRASEEQGEVKKEKLVGVLNYTITTLVKTTYSIFPESYSIYNQIQGLFDCVAREYYRKEVVPYEEEKERQNGKVEALSDISSET